MRHDTLTGWMKQQVDALTGWMKQQVDALTSGPEDPARRTQARSGGQDVRG
jgi:hypothetical protein